MGSLERFLASTKTGIENAQKIAAEFNRQVQANEERAIEILKKALNKKEG